MPPPSEALLRIRNFAVIWITAALFIFATAWFKLEPVYHSRGEHTPVGRVFFVTLLHTAVLALFAIPAAALVRWCRRRLRAGWRPLLVHFVAAQAFNILHVAVVVTVRVLIGNYPPPPRSWFEYYEGTLREVYLVNTFAYALIVAALHAFYARREYMRKEVHAARLEAELAQAQLAVLRHQLQPHFLFNALNTVSSLMHSDVTVADRVLSRLGDLLRLSLQAPERQLVALEEELGLLEAYLEIERARLGERLTVQLQVDPGVAGARVPQLLLQPLVENSIRHGIAGSPHPGVVQVSVSREGAERLRVVVADNGVGAREPAVTGVGLGNTRARLERLYGEEFELRFERGAPEGVRVTVVIPFDVPNS